MMPDDVANVLRTLSELYPQPKPELRFVNPYEALVATMLSPQCTDKQVNKVTETLFRDCPDAASLCALSQAELEARIRTVGFYHTKAANLLAAFRIILDKHAGQVPGDLDALTALPGVGRKIANVVLSNAFGQAAIAVDTHVQRVANRIGLANAKQPDKTEQQLRACIPQKDWSDAHHWLIFHGRRVCHARKPECGACAVSKWCAWWNAEHA